MSTYIITSDGNFFSTDELYHHGIKGMKWGVRRYQNYDGSLTDAGRKRQMKQLGGNGEITLAKGTEFGRVSKNSEGDNTAGSKLYVNPDKDEREVYKHMIGSSRIMENGKAYVHKYVANNDITIPSIKTQSKIELNLLKDADVRKEMIDSLMKKGYSREEAAKVVKPINMGIEYLKASPWLLAAPFNPIIGAMAFTQPVANRNRQLSLVRNSIGDANNKRMNEKFESELKAKGYNAYRDTNDRRNGVGTSSGMRKSLVVIDPDKNIRLSSSRELSKEEYGKAYANRKVIQNKKITKNVSFDDLVNDGMKEYEKLKENHVVNKYRKEEREKILKEHADDLK